LSQFPFFRCRSFTYSLRHHEIDLYFLSSCYVCLLVIVFSVLLLCLSFGHCIVSPPVNDQKTNITGGQKIQWSKDKNNRRTDNTMTKRQNYQEDRQYNDQKTNITGGQKILLCLSFGHCIVCPPVIFVFWSLYCLSSCYVCLLVIVLSVLLLFLSFDHCIFCPPVMFVFWSLWQYNDQKTNITGGQKIQWPKDKHNRRTENTMIKRQK
jgi:hypothetical protein